MCTNSHDSALPTATFQLERLKNKLPISTDTKWIIQLYRHYSILPNIEKKVRSEKEKYSPPFVFSFFHKYILKVTAVIKFSGLHVLS